MSEHGAVAAWIPQVFFDLIGRLAPGTVLIVAGTVLVAGPDGTESLATSLVDPTTGYEFPATLFVLATLAIAYVLAFLLRGLWHCGRHTLNTFTRRTRMEGPDVEQFSLKYDWIRLRSPIAGARIAKMRAETHMLGVILTGAAVLLAMDAALLAFTPASVFHWVAAALLLLVGVVSEVYRRQLWRRVESSIENHCDLLEFHKRDEAKTVGPA